MAPRTGGDPATRLRRARVLIVERNEVIRGVIRLACEQASGLEVVAEVDDGADALELVRRERPDVVVLDLSLDAGPPGAEVASAIRAARREIRILALTSRTDDRVVLESVRAGADGLLEKPSGVRFIAEALERVARGERVYTPAQERAARTELLRLARRTRARAEADARLTDRELEILEYLALGLTVKQVATRLGVSPRTIDSHVERLYRKLGARNRVEVIARAASLRLVSLA